MKLKLSILAVVLLAGLALFCRWQYQNIRLLQGENAELRESLAAAEAARSTQTGNTNAQPDSHASEMERELMQLRGEVARLRRLSNSASAKPTLTSHIPTPSDAARPMTTFKSAVSGRVPTGQTMVTGGWQTKPGKRTLLMAYPETLPGEPPQVAVRAYFVEVPEAMLGSLGLSQFMTDGNQSNLKSLMAADQTESMMKILRETPGIDTLMAPQVSVADGRQAQISIGPTHEVDGQKVHTGPTVNLLPQIAADGSGIDMTVSAELNIQPPE